MTVITGRKIILTFLTCIYAVAGFSQQSPQALFDKANSELTSGNYHQAISLYKNLEAQNTISGALFLNMGISYQRMDSLGKAKYYFLKASRFEETSPKAEQALEFVESQFSRQSAVLPKLPWDIATNWLQHNIGVKNLLIAALILLNLGILIFIVHWFVSWYPKYVRISALIIIGLAVLVLATSFYTRYVNQRYRTAVMVTQKVPVLEKPQEDASLVSQAFEGYTFTVDHYRSKSKPGWSYIRMSNGLYGWIPNSDILIL